MANIGKSILVFYCPNVGMANVGKPMLVYHYANVGKIVDVYASLHTLNLHNSKVARIGEFHIPNCIASIYKDIQFYAPLNCLIIYSKLRPFSVF